MKIIGVLDTKDDADLLPAVLNHCAPLVDAIYAYDDGSTDETFDILFRHPAVVRLGEREMFSPAERGAVIHHRRHWLLEQVKTDFPYQTEEIWIVRLEGDRFFLRQTPREIVDRAKVAGHDYRCAVQVDFHRHRADPWTKENDTWPYWNDDIRQIQRWCRVDEIQRCIAYRVRDEVTYVGKDHARPFPRNLGAGDYLSNSQPIGSELCWLEHHGKRSPRYAHWIRASGSRPVSKKHEGLYNYSTPQNIVETMPKTYNPYRVLPFGGQPTLDKLTELRNAENWQNEVQRRYFYWGVEHAFIAAGRQLPRRVL